MLEFARYRDSRGDYRATARYSVPSHRSECSGGSTPLRPFPVGGRSGGTAGGQSPSRHRVGMVLARPSGWNQCSCDPLWRDSLNPSLRATRRKASALAPGNHVRGTIQQSSEKLRRVPPLELPKWTSAGAAWNSGCRTIKRLNQNDSQEWLGGRDSNPDTQIQSLQSYH